MVVRATRYHVLRPVPITQGDYRGRRVRGAHGVPRIPPELRAIPIRMGAPVSSDAPRLGDLGADWFTKVESVAQTIAKVVTPFAGTGYRLLSPDEAQQYAAFEQQQTAAAALRPPTITGGSLMPILLGVGGGLILLGMFRRR